MAKLTTKGLLKKSKSRKPSELLNNTRELLILLNADKDVREQKRKEKMEELTKSMLEIRTILYGDGESEPNKDTCAQLTQEFFREDMFRLLIASLPKLNLETCKNATHIIANLQRQQVQSRLIASEYLEKNIDVMDLLIPGYEEGDIALSYGAILRECIRHQVVARYVLESNHMKKFFDYILIPNFEIASDAAATFKVEYGLIIIPDCKTATIRCVCVLILLSLTQLAQELMTRHKSTVAQFLSNNYDWFFQEYNSQLLESQNYITKRQAVKLLGNLLLDRSNSDVMVRYVCSLDNMRILMNLLRDPNKTIQLETFHVFKLFVANENKPPEIANVLVTNRSKLFRFFGHFNIEKEDMQFEADKVELIKEIFILEPKDIKDFSSVLSFREHCQIAC
ncbi:hypothetical protein ACLB2K_067375 [Fragaria x ananassa]